MKKSHEYHQLLFVAKNVSKKEIVSYKFLPNFVYGQGEYLEPFSADLKKFMHNREIQDQAEKFIEANNDLINSLEKLYFYRIAGDIDLFHSNPKLARQIMFLYCDRFAVAAIKSDKKSMLQIALESFYFYRYLLPTDDYKEYLSYLQIAGIWQNLIFFPLIRSYKITVPEQNLLILLFRNEKLNSKRRFNKVIQHEIHNLLFTDSFFGHCYKDLSFKTKIEYLHLFVKLQKTLKNDLVPFRLDERTLDYNISYFLNSSSVYFSTIDGILENLNNSRKP